MPKIPSRYSLHVSRWTDCQACELSQYRGKMVFAKGKLPCDVLFVGEAPGESEDVIGIPFVGPAGKLLDNIIEDAFRDVLIDERPLRLAFTNLVCCIPREESGSKAGEPNAKCIKACSPRLQELVEIAQPRLLVAVGSLSERHLNDYKEGAFVSIRHPAYILRSNIATKGLEIQRAIVALSNAIDNL